MEQIECSEKSANHNRMPGKYPKEYIQENKFIKNARNKEFQNR